MIQDGSWSFSYRYQVLDSRKEKGEEGKRSFFGWLFVFKKFLEFFLIFFVRFLGFVYQGGRGIVLVKYIFRRVKRGFRRDVRFWVGGSFDRLVFVFREAFRVRALFIMRMRRQLFRSMFQSLRSVLVFTVVVLGVSQMSVSFSKFFFSLMLVIYFSFTYIFGEQRRRVMGVTGFFQKEFLRGGAYTVVVLGSLLWVGFCISVLAWFGFVG